MISIDAQAVQTNPEDYFPNGNTTAETMPFLVSRRAVQHGDWDVLRFCFCCAQQQFQHWCWRGALILNAADGNTATGAVALLNNTTGEDNTAIETPLSRGMSRAAGTRPWDLPALTSNTGRRQYGHRFPSACKQHDGNSNSLSTMSRLAIATTRNAAISLGALPVTPPVKTTRRPRSHSQGRATKISVWLHGTF